MSNLLHQLCISDCVVCYDVGAAGPDRLHLFPSRFTNHGGVGVHHEGARGRCGQPGGVLGNGRRMHSHAGITQVRRPRGRLIIRTDGRTEGWKAGWPTGWMDGWMDGWMGGWLKTIVRKRTIDPMYLFKFVLLLGGTKSDLLGSPPIPDEGRAQPQH